MSMGMKKIKRLFPTSLRRVHRHIRTWVLLRERAVLGMGDIQENRIEM